MILTASIVFWSVVGLMAFWPHTTRFPAMKDVTVHRSHRPAPSPIPVSHYATTLRRRALGSRIHPDQPALGAHPGARLALPPGAHPMPGRVEARPMPPVLR